ncbi:MAG: MBL fold metallo-hydrolase [Sandaracinaceae bacterium]|nr:MBL fold metallo-hydrolase [Sandaracinaceae bacterium]
MHAPLQLGACVALVVEGGPARLLWAARPREAPTLPGFHVLPGGLLDPLDDALPHDGGDHLHARVACLRELFEETGILLAHGAERLDPASLDVLRDALIEGDEDAAERFAAAGLTWRTAELVPIGRWVTPDFAPERFDTRFFAVRLPAPIPPSLVLNELAHAEWIEVPEALARFARGGILAPPPLLALLRDLAKGALDEDALRALYGASGEPAQRWEVVPGVWLLPFRTPTLPPATHTNSYLVGTGEALLVEPATPYADERERMLRWLLEAKRGGIAPVAIFVTHHHVDHVGAARALVEQLGLPLWAHAETAARLDVPVARLLAHGERITLAGPTPMTLCAVHTPGHAPGHLCLYEEASGALIAGDMVASEGTILVEPQDGDMALYLASLAAMKALRPSVLLPAHGWPVREADALLDHYVAHRLAREAKIAAALGALGGPASVHDLLPTAYDDAPLLVWPLAALSLEAHLIKLEREGRAVRSAAGWALAR